jgi:hypothetical protein
MTKFVILGALILVAVIVGPILTIWALNTLFPALAIPTTLETWAATVILGGLVGTRLK